MASHPYQFKDLPRFSREQIALEASLSRYLAGRPYNPEFAVALGTELERYLKLPCKIAGLEMKSMARAELDALLPAVACIVVVGAAPGAHKIVVEIDMGLASSIIERLLGGSGEAERIQRPLTEIEEGVLSFLVLKVLNHFHEGLEHGHELALCLDRFAAKIGDIASIIDTEASYVVLGTRVGIGRQLGYVRIFLPAALVTERFGKPVPQGGATGEEGPRMLRLLEILADAPVTGRVEMATLDLSPDDLAHLELGDIVIIENHEVVKTADGMAGNVFVRLGAGKNGGLKAKLLEGEQQRIEITEIVVQEHPVEDAMADEAEAPPKENLAATEGLLRDVAAPVVVELGRIRMNAAQLVRLHQGQILRLPRAPSDPVDLVVNGKLFGRGELIEVDGELGIRLVQITGAEGTHAT